MPKFQLVSDGKSVENKLKKLRQQLGEDRDRFLELMSAEIINNSPVDTGTYITSHEIFAGSGGNLAPTASHGKPRNQPRELYAQQGFENLLADIASLPEDAERVSIQNVAVHASMVEYEHGYAPYTQARREATQLARRAKGGR